MNYNLRMNNLNETINNDAMNTMQGNAKSDIHQLVIVTLILLFIYFEMK